MNPFERNFKLRASIDDLVMSGARDIHWHNDRLQKMLEEPKPHFQLGLPLETYRDEVAFWEQLFPDFGVRIVEIIGPFLSPKLNMSLQPPYPELEREALSGITWNSSVKRARFEFAWADVAGPAVYENTLSEAAETQLCVYICGPKVNWHKDVKPVYQQVIATLTERVWHAIKPAFDPSLSGEAVKKLSNELIHQLALAIVACVRGYKQFDIQPLLALWRKSRYPWAVKRHELCIMCEGLTQPV
ncbi:MAG: hypothetical protein Q8N81_01935 [bacterium]|nr:hypothetical protein [bacterium]